MVVLLADEFVETATAKAAVAIVDGEVVEEGLTVAPTPLHEHFYAIEERGEAIGQEAVIVIECGRAVAGIVGARGVQAETPGFEHAHQFGCGEPGLRQMFEDLVGIDEVELILCESN